MTAPADATTPARKRTQSEAGISSPAQNASEFRKRRRNISRVQHHTPVQDRVRVQGQVAAQAQERTINGLEEERAETSDGSSEESETSTEETSSEEESSSEESDGDTSSSSSSSTDASGSSRIDLRGIRPCDRRPVLQVRQADGHPITMHSPTSCSSSPSSCSSSGSDEPVMQEADEGVVVENMKDRVSNFLARMKVENAVLEREKADGTLEKRQIGVVIEEGAEERDHVSACGEERSYDAENAAPYIEMNLGLGVLEHRDPNVAGESDESDETGDEASHDSRSRDEKDLLGTLMRRQGLANGVTIQEIDS